MAYVAPPSRSTGDPITAAIWNQDVKDNMIATRNLITGVSTATVSSGAITVDENKVFTITPESGNTDDLATISGGTAGQTISLKAASGKTIVLYTGGNIDIPLPMIIGDGRLTNLQYDGSNWLLENHLAGNDMLLGRVNGAGSAGSWTTAISYVIPQNGLVAGGAFRVIGSLSNHSGYTSGFSVQLGVTVLVSLTTSNSGASKHSWFEFGMNCTGAANQYGQGTIREYIGNSTELKYNNGQFASTEDSSAGDLTLLINTYTATTSYQKNYVELWYIPPVEEA